MTALLAVRRVVGEWIANICAGTIIVLAFMIYPLVSGVRGVVEWVRSQRPTSDSSGWQWFCSVMQEAMRLLVIGLIIVVVVCTVALIIAVPAILLDAVTR